jgi:hypothetical protein
VIDRPSTRPRMRTTAGVAEAPITSAILIEAQEQALGHVLIRPQRIVRYGVQAERRSRPHT